MRAYLIVIAIAIAIGLTAVSKTANAQQPAHAVPLTVIYHSPHGSLLGDLRVLVDSREEFAKYWRATHIQDSASPPPIDFTKESVLIVSVGNAGNPWTTVDVQKTAQAQNGSLDISIRFHTTRLHACVISDGPRSDTEMLRVPVSGYSAVFHEEVILEDC